LRSLKVNNKLVLLDGGLGRELRFRGVAVPKTIWSAGALMTDPKVVRQIHRDYIAAGADIITTNTYGVIRQELAKEGLEDRFAELNMLACNLAIEAREASGGKSSSPVPCLRWVVATVPIWWDRVRKSRPCTRSRLNCWPHMSTCCCAKPCQVPPKDKLPPGLPAGRANRFGWPGRCMKIARGICAAERTLQKLWPLCRVCLLAVSWRIVVRRKALPRSCPNWPKRVPNGSAATPIRLRPFLKTGPWTEKKTQMAC
jgi:hypothetical protein